MNIKLEKDRYLSMSKEAKRKQYIIGDNFIQLTEILSWNDYTSNKLQESILSSNIEFTFNSEINQRVSLIKCDITLLEIDAIVNAANKKLEGGYGVDGAIHKYANPYLLNAECRSLGGCNTGSCKITGGYRLPAKYIIHAVGPVGEKQNFLRNCYENALDLLEKNNLKSIAFPCISTGVYRYPKIKAAHIALSTIRKWFDSSSYSSLVEKIIFCTYSSEDYNIYEYLMYNYFPIS